MEGWVRQEWGCRLGRQRYSPCWMFPLLGMPWVWFLYMMGVTLQNNFSQVLSIKIIAPVPYTLQSEFAMLSLIMSTGLAGLTTYSDTQHRPNPEPQSNPLGRRELSINPSNTCDFQNGFFFIIRDQMLLYIAPLFCSYSKKRLLELPPRLTTRIKINSHYAAA